MHLQVYRWPWTPFLVYRVCVVPVHCTGTLASVSGRWRRWYRRLFNGRESELSGRCPVIVRRDMLGTEVLTGSKS